MPYKNKEDQAASARRHYEANRQKYIDKAAAARAAHKIEIKRRVDSLKTGPCTDCGVSYPPYVMQFDHTGDDKSANISDLVRRGSTWTKIQNEIAKCELVCANCHAVRTWERAASQRP